MPDPRFPFLGAHFTRRLDGVVEAGPNAVLALAREGYGKASLNAGDLAGMLAYPGFWRMSARYWKMGLEELYRSLRKAAFVRGLQALVPETRAKHLKSGGAGVRAQAVDRRGRLVDDFRIEHTARAVHVRNAPLAGGDGVARNRAAHRGAGDGTVRPRLPPRALTAPERRGEDTPAHQAHAAVV